MFRSLDYSHDDMDAARRGRFCNEWFGKRKGLGQTQSLQRAGQLRQVSGAPFVYGAGSGGDEYLMGYSQRSQEYDSTSNFVMQGKDGDGYRQRGQKKARKENGKRDRNREEEDVSQELLLHRDNSADDSSVTG